MTKLKDHPDLHFTSREIGLDFYGLEGYAEVFSHDEDESEVTVTLCIYPMYLNFFTEEELENLDISKIEDRYDVEDTGTEWENSTLEVFERFHPDTLLTDALGTLYDNANLLINDLMTGRFEEWVKEAM